MRIIELHETGFGLTPFSPFVYFKVLCDKDPFDCGEPKTPTSKNFEMAGVAGLEPVTSAVTGQRSNQLSYTPAKGKLNIKNSWLWVKWETNLKCFVIRVVQKPVEAFNVLRGTWCVK